MTLGERYSGLVCDLDGVVYRGPAAVPYAAEALTPMGERVVYATNNASRPPGEVAAHLRALGLGCPDRQVVTSSQAGAGVLAQRVPPGAGVLCVGGPGVRAALVDVGLTPGSGSPAGVLQGYGPDVTAADLAEAAYAVAAGALWVATNTDLTLPTDRGTAPGNGSLIQAVRYAVGRDPDVTAGKPFPPLYLLAADRLGASPGRLLAVGDRLETDIEGATRAGMDSLLVLTGVHSAHDAARAPAAQRPTYLAADLRSLALDLPPLHVDGDSGRCGDAAARLGPDGLVRKGAGVELLGALVASAWAGVDAGVPVDLAAVDEAIDATLAALRS